MIYEGAGTEGRAHKPGHLLCWGILDEIDALFDVALETVRRHLKELLLLLSHTLEDVDSLLRASRLYLLAWK